MSPIPPDMATRKTGSKNILVFDGTDNHDTEIVVQNCILFLNQSKSPAIYYSNPNCNNVIVFKKPYAPDIVLEVFVIKKTSPDNRRSLQRTAHGRHCSYS